MNSENRHAVEHQIAKATARALIAAGYKISVNDGEATVLKKSDDIADILSAMFSTDEDTLLAYANPSLPGMGMNLVGWVKFIYGNAGWDVISDYTASLETVLVPVNIMAEQLESSHC